MRRLAALLLAFLVACGSDAGTNPNTSEFGGTYTLQSVNGKPLPYTWTFSATASYTLRSYTITVLPGGSWQSALSYRSVSGGQTIDRPNGGELGTWTRTPSTGFVSLLSTDHTTFFTGTASGSTMTLTATSPDVYVFTR